MALVDFMERSIRVRAGGREFVLRPVTVVGMLEAQTLFAGIAPSDPEGAMARLKLAAVEGEAQAAAGLADLYLTLFDAIGTERLAQLVAIIAEPSDPALIEMAIRSDPGSIPRFLEAAASIHDFPRLLLKMAPRAAEPIPAYIADTKGIGLETVVIDLCTFLPQYRIEEVLRWPYERLLSAQEQMGIIRSIRAGVAAGKKDAMSVDELRGLGINAQRKPRPKKEAVN